jgi:hypothetical protein
MKKTTDGLGVDVAIDAVGGDAKGNFLQTLSAQAEARGGKCIPLHWAINSVKKGGIVSIVGVYGPTGNMIPVGNIVNKGLTVRANQAAVKRHLPKLIEHVKEGRIDPKAIITHRVPLEDISDAITSSRQSWTAASSRCCFQMVEGKNMLEQRTRIASSNTPVDPSTIRGWGIDANPENDPTYPYRDRSKDEGLAQNWQRPSQQQSDVEILTSIEHSRMPAVFGTSTPPSGLSGMIRRLAFRWSESNWIHWLMLMGADRINVVEGVVQDLGRAKVPNVPAEMGIKSEWQHNKKGLATKVAVTVAVGAVVVALLSRRGGDKDDES